MGTQEWKVKREVVVVLPDTSERYLHLVQASHLLLRWATKVVNMGAGCWK